MTDAAAGRIRLRPRTARPSAPSLDVPWRLAAGVAAGVVLATSSGSVFVAAALLLAAGGPWAGAAGTLAGAATVARWGTADLGALAGDQDVLGPAVASGPALAAVSSGLAAATFLLGAARRGNGAVLAAGAGAAVLACGPAPTSWADAGMRAGATVGGVAAAWLLSRPGWRLLPRLGAALGVAGVVTAVLA